MTALALITGALSRAPELRTAKSGKAYATATVKVAAADNAALRQPPRERKPKAAAADATAAAARADFDDGFPEQWGRPMRTATPRDARIEHQGSQMTAPRLTEGPLQSARRRKAALRAETSESTVYAGRDVVGSILVVRKGRVTATDASGKRLGVYRTDREAMAAILTSASGAGAEAMTDSSNTPNSRSRNFRLILPTSAHTPQIGQGPTHFHAFALSGRTPTRLCCISSRHWPRKSAL